MSTTTDPPTPIDPARRIGEPRHVTDRHGHIWRVVRDGGMVTRADDIGIISMGIAAAEREVGPLTLSVLVGDGQVAVDRADLKALRDAAGPNILKLTNEQLVRIGAALSGIDRGAR